MNCSYCNKPHKFLLLIHEDVANAGPTRKEACFRCLSEIAEKVMHPPSVEGAPPAQPQ